MTDNSSSTGSETSPEVIAPDAVSDGETPPLGDGMPMGDAVTEPAKVMRIGSMVKQLLEEVRAADLDEASRERLAEIYERSITELSDALSPDLQEELMSLALPFEDESVPSEAELRIAKAQLVGWLEGLFHGIQATLMAQQFAARQQREQMRQLPSHPDPSAGPPQGQPGQPGQPGGDRPGTYL
ncbi:MAG: bacterial proteasome activator family protein [Ilumatobacteraceae bacterium]